MKFRTALAASCDFQARSNPTAFRRRLFRALLDLTKGISTMLEAVSRLLREDQGERLWESDVEGLERSGFELP